MNRSRRKIADLEGPHWADYRGFSLIFDNPGESLQAEGGYFRLDNSPSISFYRKLRSGVQKGVSGSQSIRGMALIPLSCLHVTALDGVNDGNLSTVASPYCSETRSFLVQLPQSISELPRIAELLACSVLAKTQWSLKFNLEDLVIWSGSVLAARLSPTQTKRQTQPDSYVAFKAARQGLSRTLLRRYGLATRTPFVPHVTLGYFIDPASARAAATHLPHWNRSIRDTMCGESITLSQVRLYGFTDMATFVCSG